MYIGDPVRKGCDFLLLSPFIVRPELISPYCVLSLDFVCGPLSFFVIAQFLIHKVISVLDIVEVQLDWVNGYNYIDRIKALMPSSDFSYSMNDK